MLVISNVSGLGDRKSGRLSTRMKMLFNSLRRLLRLFYPYPNEMIFWRGADCSSSRLRVKIDELEKANFSTLGGCLSTDGFAVLITRAKGGNDLPFVVRIYALSKRGNTFEEEFLEVTNFQVDASLFWVRLDKTGLVCCLVQGYQHGENNLELYTVLYELNFYELRKAIKSWEEGLIDGSKNTERLSEIIKLSIFKECSAALSPEGKFMVFSELGILLV
jgi:hypothetical protein